MNRIGKILVVDDTPQNLETLEAQLTADGHAVISASSGDEALELLEKERPDVVLLDVVMPGMSGYEVCRRIRNQPDTRLLPVVIVTALDPREERVKGIEAGADDFLERPIRRDELLARVRSLLRIKELHDTVEAQARQLAEWNRTLEERVRVQVDQLRRLGGLKRFLPPQVAEMIVDDGAENLLDSHRRDISVVFVDLRGFTAFAIEVEPEELMGMLTEFNTLMGEIILEFQGTLERFTGDGMMVFFNDPVEISNPEAVAMRMALSMRERATVLQHRWSRQGYHLDLGIGISSGYATLGAIGFEGRRDYGAIGKVVNLASRLCDEAPGGTILVSQKVLSATEGLVDSEVFGELSLKGFPRTVVAHRVLGLRHIEA